MNKFISRWWVAILLLVIIGVGLCIRIAPIYDAIFAGDDVKFASNDAYYFVRQVDNISSHYPSLSAYDPYANYPKGGSLGAMNFFIYLLGGITWILGLGAPSQHLIDVVSAYFPAIISALTIIPIYFIGKTIFNRGVGIIAAALFTIMPGELLGRSLLGVTDRDSLEILLTTLTMLLLILAVKYAREKQLTFRGLFIKENLRTYIKPIIYSLLSGFLLGISILTWRGSYIFAGIFLVYFVVQSILDYADEESFSYLGFVGSVTFLIALLIVGSVSRSALYSTALAIAFLVPAVFTFFAWLLRRWKAHGFFYVLSIIGVAVAAGAIFYAVSPSLFTSIVNQFRVFMPTQTQLTVSEAGSILFPSGQFTMAVIWGNFTTGLYISLIALVVLTVMAFKRNKNHELFIIVWGFLLFLATMVMRRIAPFYAVAVTLLSGYLIVIVYYLFHYAINYILRRSNYDISAKLSAFVNQQPAVAAPKPVVVTEQEQQNYYAILGVPADASRKKIKKTHAQLVQKYTTSGPLSDEDKEKLRQIERAYTVLSDQQKRSSFDRETSFNVAMHKDKHKGSRKGSFSVAYAVKVAIIAVIIFFVAFYPNISPAFESIDQVKTFAPSDAWQDSLVWLRDNSPEPFGDSSSYYKLYNAPFEWQESAYCTTAWWDFGYWISKISHRIPNCDPGGGSRDTTAYLFLSQEEFVAGGLSQYLNSKYIILDDVTITQTFYAVAAYASLDSSLFTEMYYFKVEGQMTPVRCFYPEYYKSLAVRLYSFNGEAVTPNNLLVISYEERLNGDGVPYKEIISSQYFTSYQAAEEYVAQQTTGKYRIISTDPTISPVPLEKLEHYKLVHASDRNSSILTNTKISEVKIFEYVE
jgi:oligosaccharyl transferase (archaeosortase A-associated)